MSELEEKLKCAFADVGAQIGELIKCMVATEIAAHQARVNQLQSVLDGTICQESNEFPSNQLGEVPPAT